MALRLTTAPAFEPIDLELAKTHLRVDSEADDDYIETLISAVRQEAEDFKGRAWITHKWPLTMAHFRGLFAIARAASATIGDISTAWRSGCRGRRCRRWIRSSISVRLTSSIQTTIQ